MKPTKRHEHCILLQCAWNHRGCCTCRSVEVSRRFQLRVVIIPNHSVTPCLGALWPCMIVDYLRYSKSSVRAVALRGSCHLRPWRWSLWHVWYGLIERFCLTLHRTVRFEFCFLVVSCSLKVEGHGIYENNTFDWSLNAFSNRVVRGVYVWSNHHACFDVLCGMCLSYSCRLVGVSMP